MRRYLSKIFVALSAVLALFLCCSVLLESVLFYSADALPALAACAAPPPATEDEPIPTVIETGKFKGKRLNVPLISQLPELPTGCEITALAMVLAYHGFAVDKVALCEEHLRYGLDYINPFEAFLGNPFSTIHGFGCYAPPLVNAANSYLAGQSTTLHAVNVSDTAFDELLLYLDEGIPVIIWTTSLTRDTYSIYTYEEWNWFRDSHCVVIIGYDDAECLVADPMYGYMEFDRSRMKEKYELLYSQAVVVTP